MAQRAVTASDSLKFKEWIIQSCFVDRRLSAEEVAVGAPDFYCVGGYTRTVDVASDVEKFNVSDSAYWRPSTQLVDPTKTDTLSNGVVYYLSDFKIPNHIVIYRVKTKFYQIWSAMTAEQQSQYFRWSNWVEPLICNDAQGEFTLSETLPTMYYHVLTAFRRTRRFWRIGNRFADQESESFGECYGNARFVETHCSARLGDGVPYRFAHPQYRLVEDRHSSAGIFCCQCTSRRLSLQCRVRRVAV